MTTGLDKGPIFAQRRISVCFADRAVDLYARLEDAAVELFDDVWPSIRLGQLQPVAQPPGGAYHRVADMHALAAIDLDTTVTWREALDTLRALTFPPHRNIVIREGDRAFHVEIVIHPAD